MVQTIDEIAEILKTLKLDTELNAEETEKILLSVNGKLESIADDYEANSLLKDYIVDLKQTLDTRYNYTVDKYNDFENALKYLGEVQQSAIKSSDLDELLQKVNLNIETIKNSYLNRNSENVQNLSDRIDNLNASVDTVKAELSEKISLDFDTTRDLIENISLEISKQNENLINENQHIAERNSGQIASVSGSIRELCENLELRYNNCREILELKTSDLKDFMNSNTAALASAHASLENKLAEKLSALENLSHGFEANIIDVNNNLQSIIQNLMSIDPTGQNDIIKRELENIFLASNGVLSSLQIFDQKNDELAKIISNLVTNENFDQAKEKLDDIINKINALDASLIDMKFAWNFTETLDKINTVSSIVEEVKNIIEGLPKSENLENKFKELNENISNIVTKDGFNTFRSELTNFIQEITSNSNLLNSDISQTKEKLEQILLSLQSADLKDTIQDITNTLNENSTNNLAAITSNLSEISEKVENTALNFHRKADENAEKITGAINEINGKIESFRKEMSADIAEKNLDLTAMSDSLHDFISEISNIYRQEGPVLEEKISVKLSELEKYFTESVSRYDEKLIGFKSDMEKFNIELSSIINAKTEDITVSLVPLTTGIQQIIEYDFSAKFRELKEQIEDVYNYVTAQIQTEEQNQIITGKLEDFYHVLLEKITVVDEDMSMRAKNNLELLKAAIEEIKHLLCSNMSINSQFIDETKIFLKEIDERIEQLSANCAGVLSNVSVDVTNVMNVRLDSAVEELKDYIGTHVSANDLMSGFDNIKSEIAAKLNELDNKLSLKEDDYSTKEEVLLILRQLSGKIDEIGSNYSNAGLYEIDSESREQLISGLNELKESIMNVMKEIEISTQASFETIREKLDLLSENNSDAALYNKLNDIYDKTDEISKKLNTKYSGESNEISQTLFSLKDKIDASSEVNTKIAASLLNIAEKYSGLRKNTEQTTELLKILQDKISSISENDTLDADTVLNEIKNIKSMISAQRQYLEDTEISERTIAMADCLQELEKKIDDIAQNAVAGIDLAANTNDIKNSLTEVIANVFAQISFMEESEEIKGFVEEKTEEIAKHIQDVQYQIRHIARNSDDETYSYSLQDVESDIAKLRLILNQISDAAQNDEIKRLSDNVSKVENTLKDLNNTLTLDEFAEFKEDFEKINEDIVSISSRTNKLLLNSDNSYKSLNEGLDNFRGMVNNLNEKIDNLSAVEVQRRMEQKITNINNAVAASAASNKVIREVLMYLGEWMDVTSENINTLSEKTFEISDACEKLSSVNDAVKELKKSVPEKSDLLNALENKFEEQQERIDSLENKLDKVLKTIETAYGTKLTKKVDKIEKLINKLSSNVEKQTPHADEK